MDRRERVQFTFLRNYIIYFDEIQWIKNWHSCVATLKTGIVALRHRLRRDASIITSIALGYEMRHFLLAYARKYGISRVKRKYNKNCSFIYMGLAQYDGSVQSPAL